VAFFKCGSFLQKQDDPRFDQWWGPSVAAPPSGIFRCIGCGTTISSTVGNHLPPQNHHQHTAAQGAIRWQPIVKAHHQ
jgi:hypothetical protein